MCWLLPFTDNWVWHHLRARPTRPRMSLVGRLLSIAAHHGNVRYLEGAQGFANFSEFSLVVSNGNHKADGQIVQCNRLLSARSRPTPNTDKPRQTES